MCIYSPMPHTLSYCALIGKCALIRSNTVSVCLNQVAFNTDCLYLHSFFVIAGVFKLNIVQIFIKSFPWILLVFGSCKEPITSGANTLPVNSGISIQSCTDIPSFPLGEGSIVP